MKESDGYFKTYGNLLQYCRYELNDNIADFESYKFRLRFKVALSTTDF